MLDSEFYKKMLENLYDGVYFVDTKRRITFWNKGAERISGFSSKEVMGSHCYNNILNHVDKEGNHLCKGGCPLHATILDGAERENEVFLQHKKGHRVPVFVRTIPIYEEKVIIGAVEIFVDNSERLEIIHNMKKLEELAMTDELTHLPNRRYSRAFITSKLNDLRELGIPFGLAFFDIDNFKNVNDTYGHDVGDDVLKLLAKTTVNTMRKSDLVARWGGEEFLAIFLGIDDLELGIVTEKLRFLIEHSGIRLNKEDTLRITVSIGATMAKMVDDVDSLVDRADGLMYQSKINGKNRISIEE